MGKKLSELAATTDFAPEDVFHLRTIGGIDKKITGENCLSKYDRGEVASFIRKVRPGWIWCDGSTISDIANPEYAELIVDLKAEAGADAGHPYYHLDADKAVLPDLRGATVRGVDAAANRDKDGVRKSGGYQADGNDPHVHTINHGHNFRFRQAVGDSGANYFRAEGMLDYDVERTLPVVDHAGNSGNNGVGEGTVKNIALYILIKY